MGEVLSATACPLCFSQTCSGLSVCSMVRVVQLPGRRSEDHAQPHSSVGYLSVLAADPCRAPGSLHQEFVQYSHTGEARCNKILTLNLLAVLLRYLKTLCMAASMIPLFSLVGAGLHRSAGLAGWALLPVLLLHGDWSCQVLIWSHP